MRKWNGHGSRVSGLFILRYNSSKLITCHSIKLLGNCATIACYHVVFLARILWYLFVDLIQVVRNGYPFDDESDVGIRS